MKKIFTLCFLMALVCVKGWGQTVTIPTSNTSSGTQVYPLDYYYGYSRSAMIYTASELGTTTAGGTITSVSFYCNTAANTGPTVVYLKAVGTTTIETATSWASKITGLTALYSGTPAVGVAGWRTLTLATPFALAAAQNLEVLVECNYGNGGVSPNTGNAIRYTTTSSNTFAYYHQDNSAPTANLNTGTSRPNIQLIFASPLSIGTITATQQATSTITRSSASNNILSLTIPVSGTTGTQTLTSVTVNAANTNNADIAAGGVKLWTGTSTAPVTQIGTAQSFSGGVATFTGLTTAITATTYLWVTYDISSTATLGDLVDATIPTGGINITASGGATAAGTQPPSALNPSGNGTIGYCIPTYTTGTGSSDVITNVTYAGINNTTGASSSPYYTLYSTPVASVYQGGVNNFTISVNSAGGNEYVGMWIDLDNDGIFSTTERFINNVPTTSYTLTQSITIPAATAIGNHRMRVRISYFTTTNFDPCNSSYQYGETEDYIVNVTAPPTCTAPTIGSITATSTSASVVFTCTSCSPGNAYIIEYGASGFTPGAGATAGTGGIVVTGTTSPIAIPSSGSLSPNSTYDVYIRQNCTSASNGYSANSTKVTFITLPGCVSTTAPANNATGVCSIPPAFTWTAPTGGATSYKFYLGTDGGGTSTPTTLINGTNIGNVLTYSPSVTLASNTVYYWQVVAVNATGSATSCSIQKFTTITYATGAVAPPYTQNFECSNDLNFVNGSQTNQWVIGTATNNGGSRAAYISNDGSSNAYTGTISTVHFYKDVTFPANSNGIVSFDWKGLGESGYDRLLVYAAPTTVTPTAGSPASSSTTLTGATLLWTQPNNNQTTFTNAIIPLTTTIIGNTASSATVRIIFTWQNDDLVTNPPPTAIDNISITVAAPCTTPPVPTGSVSFTSTQTSVTGSFSAPTPAPTGYLVIRTTTSTPPTVPTDGTSYTAGQSALGGYIVSTNTTTGFTDNGLTPSTTYYYWIYSYNSTTCTGGPLYSATSLNGSKATTACTVQTNTLAITGGNATYDWNTAANWSLGHVPYPCENAVISYTRTTAGSPESDVNLSAPATVNNLTITGSYGGTGTKVLNVDAGSYALTINGDLNITSTGGSRAVSTDPSATYLASGTGGSITVNGNATIGGASDTRYSFLGSDGGATTININGNLTYNTNGGTTAATSTTFVFNGTNPQTITNNNTAYFSDFGSAIIGNGNPSVVTLVTGLGSNIAPERINGGNLTINANATLNIPNGTTLNQAAATSTGTFTINSSGTLQVGGNSGGYSAGNNFPLNFGIYTLATSSTVVYNGTVAQTVAVPGTYGNLTIANAAGVATGSATAVAGTLALSSGILATTSANSLTVTNTSPTGVNGGSTTAFVNGPLKWTLPTNLVASGNVYAYPVGSGSTYLPFSVTSLTTGTTSPVLQVQAFTGTSGGSGDGTTLSASSSLSTTEYWNSVVSGGSVINASVSLTRQTAVDPYNVVAESATKTGSYTAYGGTPSGNSILNSNNIANTATQYYVMAVTPTLTLVTALSPTSVTTCSGTASPNMTLAVSGNGLTNGITVTAPTGFEVSLSATSGFGSSVTIGSGGTVTSTTVYVRLSASDAANTYSGNIIISSPGAPQQTAAISPSVVSAATVISPQPNPTDQDVCQNSTTPVTLTVGATGSGTLTYQWYKNTSGNNTTGTSVGSANGGQTPAYTVPTATTGSAYYYVIVTSSTCGPTTSNVSGRINVVTTTIGAGPSPATQTFCQSAAGTHIAGPIAVSMVSGIDVDFTWYSNTVNSTTTGTAILGAPNSRTLPASFITTDTYGTTYYYVLASGTCGSTTSTTAQVIINPATAITVQPSTTPQTVCQNSTATTLSVTAVGTNPHYQWYSNTTATATGGTAVGTDAPTYTPVTTTPGSALYYYVTVTGDCAPPSVTSTVSGKVTVTPQPSATISYAGTPFCTSASPGAVTFNGTTGGMYSSATGLSINASNGNVTPSTSTPGTYTVTYTVAAAGGCAVYTATTSVTVNPTPVATVAANNPYACAGSGGSFTITGTPNSTVSYNLNGGSGTSKTLDGSGNGTVPVGIISSSVTITLTSVSASAATGGCTSTPAGAGSTATITTAPLPAVYNLTGGGNYCPGGTGVPVGLDGSQSGVSYQLLVDNGTTTSPAGSPAAGNGGVLTFGNQTTVGTYSVQATNTTTGCVKTGGGTTVMVGQYTPATITADATPATQTVCQNGTPMDLTVTAVGNNLVYQWYSNTTSSTTGGTAITNTNSSSYTPVTTAPGTLYYYVTVSGPCRTVTSRVVSVTVSALPTASFTASSYSACGSAVAIGVSGTNGAIVNYSYTGTATGSGSVTLTGGSATTDGTGTINSLSSPGTYNYTVTSITNGCTGSSGSTTTATIDPAPSITLSSAAGTDNQSICKSGQITTITYSVTSGGTPTVTGLPAGVTSSYGNGVFTIGTPTGNTPTVTGVYPYTVTVPGGACGTPVTISGVITASVSWNPIGQSVDWNTGSNWCSGSIPMPADYVTIPANKPSPVLSGDVEIGSLDLAATRTVSIGSYTLQVNGAVSGAGTLTGSATSNLTTGGTGTVNFTPTAGSNVLRNLAVNGGTLTLGNALNITAGNIPGVVTVSGAGQLATAGNLTLKSDKNGTASVAAHTGTTHIADYITGNVTAERYTDGGITTGKRAWRLVTSPVTDQTISQAWQEGLVYDATAGPNSQPSTYGTIITGEKLSPGTAGSLGFDYVGGGNNASIKRYDAATNAWVPLPNTNSTLVRGAGAEQAYMLFIRGDRTQSTPAAKGPDNLHPTGTLLQGPQTVTVPSGNTFTVVGNPYAAPLNFAQVHAGNTSIQDKFYAWDTHLNDFGAYVVVSGNNGTYQAVPSAMIESGTVSVTQYIQSGQGFLVVPDNGGGTLTITENMKNTAASTATSASPFRVVPSKMKQIRVNLNLKGDTSATLADGFLAKFDDYYSDIAAQQEGSSRKAWNFNENLNLVSGGKAHIIEARADVQKTDTLFMQMWNVTRRSYQLQMKADNFTSAPGVQAWLVDNYLGTRQELSLKGDIAAIDFSVTSDSLSSKTSRFMIVFQNNAVVLPVTLTSVKAAPANGGVNVSWTVTNEVNIKGYTVERSADGGRTYTAIATQTAKNATAAAVTGYTSFDNVPKAGENLYRIRIEAKEGTISYSAAVKITIGEGDGSIQIAVYPNPVRDGKVSLQLSNLKAGTYLAAIYSEGGQTVYQKKITISQPNTTQSEELRLGKALAQGSYQVRIADHNGAIVKETQLIVGR